MALVTNVFRRGVVYYFRVRVPPSLQAAVARKELWRSLGTSQAGIARQHGLVLTALTERLWHDLKPDMTEDLIRGLIQRWQAARSSMTKSEPPG